MEFPNKRNQRSDPPQKRSNMGAQNSIPAKKFNNEPRRMMKPYKLKKPLLRKKLSDADTKIYREGYPGKKDNPHLKKNLMFYKNEIPSHPNGDYIDNIHEKWFGDWDKLEQHHGYIQWLFPIREMGMNYSAQELQLHESKAIQEDPKCRERVIKSYRMMLDFFGIQMEDASTGWLKRSPHWRERLRHLNLHSHNFLRITRILKSLGEFGFEHLKAPFCEFILCEAIEQSTCINTMDSCLDYWRNTIKDDSERLRLRHLADQLLGVQIEGDKTESDSDASDKGI